MNPLQSIHPRLLWKRGQMQSVLYLAMSLSRCSPIHSTWDIIQDDCGIDKEVRSERSQTFSHCHESCVDRFYTTCKSCTASLYQPYCIVLRELSCSQVSGPESFINRCLRVILGISVREKCHKAMCKLAKQKSIILVHCCLHFLEHLA